MLSVYKNRIKVNVIPKQNEFVILTETEVEENGILTRKSVYQTVNPSSESHKFHSDDFNIRNIVAIGAYDMLKPIMMSEGCDFNYVDSFETRKISDYVPEAQNAEKAV